MDSHSPQHNSRRWAERLLDGAENADKDWIGVHAMDLNRDASWPSGAELRDRNAGIEQQRAPCTQPGLRRRYAAAPGLTADGCLGRRRQEQGSGWTARNDGPATTARSRSMLSVAGWSCGSSPSRVPSCRFIPR